MISFELTLRKNLLFLYFCLFIPENSVYFYSILESSYGDLFAFVKISDVLWWWWLLFFESSISIWYFNLSPCEGSWRKLFCASRKEAFYFLIYYWMNYLSLLRWALLILEEKYYLDLFLRCVLLGWVGGWRSFEFTTFSICCWSFFM